MSTTLDFINEILATEHNSVDDVPVEDLHRVYLIVQIAYISGRIEEATGEPITIFNCNIDEDKV